MNDITLTDLGWSDFFARQTDFTGSDAATLPARIAAIHRDRMDVLGASGALSLTTTDPMGTFAVGDWLLHDGNRVTRRLERQSEIARRAAHEDARTQLIAANIDTLGIVTSCNNDFNPARIERYLALSTGAGALPLVILTKPDLADDPDEYLRRARKISPLITAVTLNAKDPDDIARLAPWCRPGQTLALVGSSGVGKTTIRNQLTGETAATAGIRDDDARGRHTTTARELRRTAYGGWLIDTPGMRELGLTDTGDGVDEVFSDVTDLLTQCRFRDCAHDGEPGCAVTAALNAGTLDPARLDRWRKLSREEERFSASEAQLRQRQKSTTRFQKSTQSGQRRKKGDIG